MNAYETKNSFGLKLKENFQNFIYSTYFPLAVAFFTVFIYFTKMQLAGAFTFCLFAMIVLIIQKDMSPLIPPLFNVVFLFSDLSVFNNPLSFIVFVPLIIGFIVHLVKYPIKKVKFGLYGISLIVMFLSLVLGGVLTKEYLSYFAPSESWFGEGLSLMIGVGLGMIVEYFILKNGLYNEERKDFNLKIYFSYTLVFTAIGVAIQLLIMRALNYPRDFGWGNINFCGYVFMLAVPSAIYLMIKTKHIFTYSAIILALFFVTYVSGSDGALGTMLMFTPLMLIYAYFKLDKKQKQIFFNTYMSTIIIGLILVIAVIIYDGSKVNTIIKHIVDHFFNDTGRTPLYKMAIDAFKENAIFGLGIFYPIKYTLGKPILVNYHSSIFNTLATTGLFGMVALIFNYFARAKILMKNNSLFNSCAFFAVAMYIAYSSVDHGEVTMLLILVTGILAVTEKLNASEKSKLKPLLN